jgi:hypothetical protein
MKSIFVFVASCALAASALAKLPAPSDEAKAKAAEAAAKTAHTGKVEAYLLCKSQDKVAAHYQKTHKTATKAATPPCADPGPFVYTPAGAAPAAAAPAAPVAAAPVAKKKP